MVDWEISVWSLVDSKVDFDQYASGVQSVLLGTQCVIINPFPIFIRNSDCYDTERACQVLRQRSFATVPDTPPVRRYGGLKDQDRIFTNAYCKHDRGIKGAKVSCF